MNYVRGRIPHSSPVVGSFLLILLVSGVGAGCGGLSADGGVVGAAYVIGVSANGDTSLVALSAKDGRVRWQTPIPLDSESAVASVTATPAQVYVVSGGKPSSGDWSLLSVNADTGKLAWHFPAPRMITSIQAEPGGGVFVGTEGGVYLLRASDGVVVWRHDGTVAALVLGDSVLYVAFRGDAASANAVLALARDDGPQSWQHPLDEPPVQLSYQPSGVYVTTATKMVRLAAKSGTELWSSQTTGGSLVGVVGSNLYLTQKDAQTIQLAQLDVVQGYVRWRQALLSNWYGVPLLTKTAVYAKLALNTVCAMRPSDGGTAWCYQGSQPVVLAANDGTAYTSDVTGELCALQADGGSHRWCQRELEASSMVLAAARLFLTTPGGAVCALQADGGEQIWCHHAAQTVLDLTVDALIGL